MSEWYGVARSNRFAVKDIDAFRKAIEHLEIDVAKQLEDNDVIIYSNNENGGWNDIYFCEETNEYIGVDFYKIIQEHLVDGEVAILLEVGNEKFNYLSGEAIAISTTEINSISLCDIYDIARKMTDKEFSYAEY